jgi:hypothetical protein
MLNNHQHPRLCPVSFGLALGLTSGLAMLLWCVWAMFYGVTPMMEAYHMPVPDWSMSIKHAALVFVKGFIFGAVLVIFYDFIACCMRKMCGNKESCKK